MAVTPQPWIVTTVYGADETVDGWPSVEHNGVLAFYPHGESEAAGFVAAYAPGAWMTCRPEPANEAPEWSQLP